MRLILTAASLSDGVTQPFHLLAKETCARVASKWSQNCREWADQCGHLLTLRLQLDFHKPNTRRNLAVFHEIPARSRQTEHFATQPARNFTLSYFLRSPVNQRVNGFLNHRFSLHYDDCPERESEGIPVFSLARSARAHTHTHIPDSQIPLQASRCLHGQSTSSNQLKTALSSWSMAGAGVGQDEDSAGGEQLLQKKEEKGEGGGEKRPSLWPRWVLLLALPTSTCSLWHHAKFNVPLVFCPEQIHQSQVLVVVLVATVPCFIGLHLCG